MEVLLHIFRPDKSSRHIPVKPGRYLVGRNDDATLRIPLPTVSRKHCELVHDGSRLHVRDLGSSNGTFRNHERIQESELAAGDVLGIGDFMMVVQIDGVPAQVQPPVAPPAPDPGLSDTPESPVASQDDDEDDEDLERTITKPGVGSLLAGSQTDESSIFDFDFDFEDDENPQL